ncbi:MAG: annexin [Cyanobacteria bacterium SIG30]|nr:annexin [Cyanobacteria bacterium SIG30]
MSNTVNNQTSSLNDLYLLKAKIDQQINLNAQNVQSTTNNTNINIENVNIFATPEQTDSTSNNNNSINTTTTPQTLTDNYDKYMAAYEQMQESIQNQNQNNEITDNLDNIGTANPKDTKNLLQQLSDLIQQLISALTGKPVEEVPGTPETDETPEVGVPVIGQPVVDNKENIQNSEEYQEKYGVSEDFDAKSIAKSLHNAISGWGTDEEVVEKYLDLKGEKALNDAELKEVMDIYEELYDESLEDAVKGDFSGNEKDKYVGRIKNAEENKEAQYALKDEAGKKEMLKEIAEEFYSATTDKLGTDEETVYKIMQLEPEMLKDLIEHYNNSGYSDKHDFLETIKKEFSGDAKKELIELYNKAMEEQE